MQGDIDSIAIEVSSDADAAVRSLTELVDSLSLIEKKVGSSASRLLQFSNAMRQLKTSIAGFDLSGVKQLSEVKFSATVPKNLGALSEVIATMPSGAAAKLSTVSLAMSGLKNISVSKGSIDQLARIPQVAREFENFNASAFVSQMIELNSQLAPLAANVEKLAAAYAKLPKSMQTAGLAARSVASSNKYLKTSNTALVSSNKRVASSFSLIGTSMRGLVGKVMGLTAAFAVFKRGFDATIGNVNRYIENMNLFDASMGEYAESAKKYARTVQDALGIDMSDWVRNQGVFQSLITGMGETAQRASVMSQQLTQLGYDIASFYNISVEDAMLKVQSGIAGELEPLRRIGYDLSVARMQIEATNLGIDKSVQSMTQAEKVGLRYHMIMTQLTQIHGDMARTIASPANQLRVLQAQLSLTARAIGNLFIPALNMILPVVMAVVKAIRLLAQTIASFFGIDATFEVDYSTLDTSGISTGGVDDLADSLDKSGSAADKAKKKVQEYKNTVMGFDELNKLNDTPEDTSSSSGGSGSGAGAGGGGLDLPLETYDFLAGLSDNISAMTDQMAESIFKLLPLIGALGAAFTAWKIAGILTDNTKGIKKMAGAAMLFGGAALFVFAGLDAWSNGVDWANLLEMCVGLGLAVAGAAILFGEMGAGIALAIGGLALMTIGLKDFLDNGPTLENMTAIFVGFAAVVGGLALAFGTIGAAVGLVIGGIALLVAGFVDFFENGPSATNTGMVVAGILAIGGAIALLVGWPALVVAAVVAAVAAIVMNWEAIATFFTDLWNTIVTGISDWWSGVVEWFDMNVIQPVCLLFSAIGEFLSGLWATIVDGIVAFWSPVASFFSELFDVVFQTISDVFYNIGVIAEGCWTTISLVWEVVSGWFNDNVIQPIVGFFTLLWNTVAGAAQAGWNLICGIWTTVSSWFNSNVIQPVRNFFQGLWQGITTFATNAWNTICGIFSSVGGFIGGVVDSVSSAFRSIVNWVIGGINSALSFVFGGINRIIGAVRSFNVMGIQPFANLRNVNVPQVPYLSTGGQVNSGQLFVARENGIPELVGKMGNQTTVANNDQIVQGIEVGVTRAMLQVMSATRSEGGGPSRIEIPLIIGRREVARAVYEGKLDLVRDGVINPQFA